MCPLSCTVLKLAHSVSVTDIVAIPMSLRGTES